MYPRISTENNQRQEILVKSVDFFLKKGNRILQASGQSNKWRMTYKREGGGRGRSWPHGEPGDTISQGRVEPCVWFPVWSPVTAEQCMSDQAFPRGQRGAVDEMPSVVIGRHRTVTRAGGSWRASPLSREVTWVGLHFYGFLTKEGPSLLRPRTRLRWKAAVLLAWGIRGQSWKERGESYKRERRRWGAPVSTHKSCPNLWLTSEIRMCRADSKRIQWENKTQQKTK